GAPPRRRQEAPRRAQSPRGCWQHDPRRRTPPRRHQVGGLRHRPRAGGRRRGWRDRSRGDAGGGGPDARLVHRQVPRGGPPEAQRQESLDLKVFYGWIVVAGAFLVLFVAYGAQYSFGVFFSAFLQEFGWSRASLSGAFSVYAFAYCVFGFPAGRLTDLWGPRVVIATGGLFLGVALAGMSLVAELWQPYVLYGLVAGLGMSTAYVPCNTTVVKWFVARRGLAVGLASSGASVGTFALPPLAQLLVASVGWRTAYVVFGVGIFLLVNLVAQVMRRDPESLGLHPDGARRPLAAAGADEGVGPLTRAIRTRAFKGPT